MLAGRCRLFAVLATLCFPAVAFAQAVPPSAQPGRERDRFVEPQTPRAQPGGTIGLPGTVAPSGAETIRLTISRIVVSGASVYSEADLAPLYADLIGKDVPLAAVYEIARRITAKYGADGYVLSRAVVPPQNLGRRNAVIRIQVVEGYVDRVVWPEEKLARFRDFFTAYAAKMTADRPANIRTIERYLLLANDLPGLKFTSSLKPSPNNPNASTLVVDVKEKRIDAVARVDNRGTDARGPWQYLGTATVNNILGAHEAFTLTYAGTFQMKELQYLAATYRQVLNSEGLTGFVNASYGFGKPGTAQLELLEYKTRSTVVEAGLSYPVIRSREKNLTLTGLGFMTNDDGDQLGQPFSRDRLRGFRLKADGDWADMFLGINQVNFTFSQGVHALGSTSNDNPISSRPDVGRVDFNKVEGTYSRVQPLFGPVSAFFAAYGQYAFAPLLVSEQCSFGGRFFGRAFDPSQLLGDHCWEIIGELRYDFTLPWKQITRAQLYAYADHGEVFNMQPDFFTPAVQAATSAGGGVRVAWEDIFTADLSVAKAIEGPRNDWRFFVVLGAKY